MLVLGIDTSGRHGSLALARAGQDEVSFDVLEVVPLAGGEYSARLIPELAAMLARHHIEKKALEAFAVVSGPGSFTGLRVGLAAAKGLAEIFDRPLAAVSMLELIAAQASESGPVVAALDAGRKELYVGLYEVSSPAATAGDSASPTRESLLSQLQFSELLAASADAELITPDETVAELAVGHLRVKKIEWPDAAAVARLGTAKLRAGHAVSPEALEANYIRRSDAEIFSRPVRGT